MAFDLREHTADVAVSATGETVAAVFAAVADGLAAASCDAISADGDRFDLRVTAESREALLFDYLDELIYLRDVRGELPVDNEVTSIERVDVNGADRESGMGGDAGAEDANGDAGEAVDGDGESVDGDGESVDVNDEGTVEWHLEASARGVPLSRIDAREVKAVTYSEMDLRATEEGWTTYVVFDV